MYSVKKNYENICGYFASGHKELMHSIGKGANEATDHINKVNPLSHLRIPLCLKPRQHGQRASTVETNHPADDQITARCVQSPTRLAQTLKPKEIYEYVVKRTGWDLLV